MLGHVHQNEIIGNCGISTLSFIIGLFQFQSVCFQVVLVDQSGHQVPGCYGSHVNKGNQSLGQPLSLCDAGENHILVSDYRQHRVHLVTTQLQFVRHLVARDNSTGVLTCIGDTSRGVTFPRQICLDSGLLFIGTYSGQIGIYRVQQEQL